MRNKKKAIVLIVMAACVVFIQCAKTFERTDEQGVIEEQQAGIEKNKSLVAQGKEIFRLDTYGDEDFWSGLLHIDKAIAGEKNGGFGAGVSPKTALAVGLKVDAEALPAEVVSGISNGTVNLDDPATTLTLLKLNAVV